ncbi:MAG: carbohydrate ABC transporter permease [Mesorhizobium sp.]|nr:MAG: carbohydrate ABC transporter permease [Mesorhizobium sp.]
MNDTRSPLQTIAIYLGALLILVWSGGPFIWQFSTSFQLDKALTSGSPSLIPAPFTLEHYYNAFIEKQLHRYVWNSLVVSLATTFLCLFVGSLAAFALSRLNVKGRFGILMVILSVSMFPQIALVGPLYLVATNLGLLDTYTALIITYLALGLPLVTWVLFGYFETLPREIDEAARMDGASLWNEIVYVLTPMAVPGIASTMLLNIILAWNEAFWTIRLTTTEAAPLTAFISSFSSPQGLFWAKLSAASTLAIAPILIMGWFSQKQLVRGLTFGAVK